MAEKLSLVDIGEPLEESCEFCIFPQNGKTALYEELYGISSAVPFAIPAGFHVMHEIVPLGEDGGQVMLFPASTSQGHDLALAQVQDQEQLRAATAAVLDEMSAVYPGNPIFVYEHGTGFINNMQVDCGGCHVNHAHGNVVVLPKDRDYYPLLKNRTEEILAQQGWANPKDSGQESAELFTGVDKIAGRYPYIHIGIMSPNGIRTSTTYVQRSGDERIQSQLMRRVIGEVVHENPDPIFWHSQDARLFTERNILRERVNAFRNRLTEAGRLGKQ